MEQKGTSEHNSTIRVLIAALHTRFLAGQMDSLTKVKNILHQKEQRHTTFGPKKLLIWFADLQGRNKV